jgi:RNA polymerase-binding transcription factor DksA
MVAGKASADGGGDGTAVVEAAKATKGAKATKASAADAKEVEKVAKPAPPPKPKKLPPPLAPSTLEKLRERLVDERDRHLRQADELQAEAEVLASEREQGDTQFDEESGEGDTVSVERERDLALSASARQTVDVIERALAKMEDGTYGLCLSCGDRIPVARLEVIPWAELCVKCKARGERRR